MTNSLETFDMNSPLDIPGLLPGNEIRRRTSQAKQSPDKALGETRQKILSGTTFSGMTQPEFSSKKWNNFNSSDLKLLEKQVKALCEVCESECLIPAYKVRGLVDYVFACRLKDGKIIIEESSTSDPDFFINAKIKILNVPFEDSALEKKFRNFFHSGHFIDFACTILYDVKSFNLKNSLSRGQKEFLVHLFKATKLYLQYRNSLKD